LLEQNPHLEELFPKQKDIASLTEIEKSSTALKKVASSNGSDNKSREAKKSKSRGQTKTKSTESN